LAESRAGEHKVLEFLWDGIKESLSDY
jgi:hypothetical protein